MKTVAKVPVADNIKLQDAEHLVTEKQLDVYKLSEISLLTSLAGNGWLKNEFLHSNFSVVMAGGQGKNIINDFNG